MCQHYSRTCIFATIERRQNLMGIPNCTKTESVTPCSRLQERLGGDSEWAAAFSEVAALSAWGR